MSLAERITDRLKSLTPARFADAVHHHLVVELERAGWMNPEETTKALDYAENLAKRVAELDVKTISVGEQLAEWMERATQRSATISELTKAGADAEAQMQALDAQLRAVGQGRAEAITIADEHFRGLTQSKLRIKELEAGIEGLYVERNAATAKFRALAEAAAKYLKTAPIPMGDAQMDDLRADLLMALMGAAPELPKVGSKVRPRAGVQILHVIDRRGPYLMLNEKADDSGAESQALFVDVVPVDG